MLEMNVGTLLDKAILKYKEKIAVKMGDKEITYRELGEKSNRLAHVVMNFP